MGFATVGEHSYCFDSSSDFEPLANRKSGESVLLRRQDRNQDYEMINRLLFVLAAVCAITAPCVHAQPARDYSLTDLLRLGGQVIAANESHIWVFVESLRNNDHEFYICSYNKDEPQAGSICREVT